MRFGNSFAAAVSVAALLAVAALATAVSDSQKCEAPKETGVPEQGSSSTDGCSGDPPQPPVCDYDVSCSPCYPCYPCLYAVDGSDAIARLYCPCYYLDYATTDASTGASTDGNGSAVSYPYYYGCYPCYYPLYDYGYMTVDNGSGNGTGSSDGFAYYPCYPCYYGYYDYYGCYPCYAYDYATSADSGATDAGNGSADGAVYYPCDPCSYPYYDYYSCYPCAYPLDAADTGTGDGNSTTADPAVIICLAETESTTPVESGEASAGTAEPDPGASATA
jgi:hypothetical protein